ncbi:hypothetical protein AQJ66_26370 [Streptomyces bungoensis]|uniref:Macro domain-containing protein n=1 Tax=Streptomyces bungoensis TaxID=285568 RepID=A0A101SUF1_9ACTN|nr:P-loop NTPase fold protein [Streptomyces bungoensis]KUN80268.1 hypothetical protein AQJ66_26370 [Streptomyces bungoensis]
MGEAEPREDGSSAEEPGRVSFEVTDKPWDLPVDAVVLSVGAGLGRLAVAVRGQFPQAPWDSVPFDEITPDRPWRLLLRTRRTPGAGPWLAVLATPHAQGGSAPTLDSIARATKTAIREAADAGATSVGVPMLATGSLGLPMSTVARVAVPTAVSACRPPLRHLVFLVQDEEDVPVLTAARTSVPLAGGTSSDWVDPNAGIPLAEDHLGVAPYVSMLAAVISDRTTPTPLSVGVFGEWGSGKSYFMGLLRHQVDELAASGRPGYCCDVVQIGFNAWHYADSNIWASLGDEIFRQLAGPGPTSEERRRRLRSELAERLDQRREHDAMTRQARLTAAALQADVEAAAAARKSRVRDLIEALRKSPELARRMDALWRKLGVRDDAEKAKLLMGQLRGTLTEADVLRRAPVDRAGRLALGAAAFAVAAGLVLTGFTPEVRGWLEGAGGVFTVFSGAALTRARAGLRTLGSLAEDLRSGLDQAAQDRAAPEVAEALDALRQAEADQRVAEAQLDDVVSHIGELGRQLTELSPGHRLYSFLADRAHADSYTGNLGLISTIRKDFEQLVALMADWRDHPEQDGGGHRPIDRIVLYIDDLDRCGPRQVVEVLQAVHLLLALDLFVVVIGVDSRWLLRSLSSHYAEILDDGPNGAPATDLWRVTPEDYLEKIINIPLVLPGIPSGGLRRLLSSIVDDGAAATAAPAASTTRRTSPAPAPAGERERSRFAAESGSEIGAQDDPASWGRPPQPLTERELTLLSALDALIDTPREAKRLFNLYRMLRATRDLSPASRFLGEDGEPGEYQAVVVLLGLLTGHARLFGQILDTPPDPDDGVTGGLMRRSRDTPWERFVTDLRPRGGANRVVGALPEGSVPEWSRLYTGMLRVSAEVTLHDVSCFQLWVPRIRRFSYLPSQECAPRR